MLASIKRLGGAVLLCTGMLACLLAISPAAAGAKGHKSCRAPKSAWKFVSTKLRPARIHVCTRKHGTDPGMVFLGLFHDAQFGGLVGQAGALMVDEGGNPVWFHPAPKNEQDSDFQTQNYGSTQKPVLAFWQGEIALPPHQLHGLPAGAPVKGSFLVYNNHYKQIRTIKAQGKGWITDFHELILTKPTSKHKQGTAIFFAAKKIHAKHSFEDEEVQQLDLATNKLIFTWDVAKHVPLSASHVRAPRRGVWDPYHANSISLATSADSVAHAGDLLVSLRNTWGAYDVSTSGSIRWKLINGKGSKYKVSGKAKFFWQHDVRFAGKDKISMFDDGCCNLGVSGPEHAARGLVLSLSKGRASVASQYHHPQTSEIPTSGNVQFLPKGHTFIGWGQSWFYSEYAGPKKMVYDAAMPRPDMSYRAFKGQWTGLPGYGPAFAVRKGKVYVSWNGATGVSKWRVLAGKSKSKLKSVASAKRSGFETAIHAKAHGPYFRVQALNAKGKVIGQSGVKKVSG